MTSFLFRGGEIGDLLRTMDWTGHPLGPPETWPLSLKATLGIMLNSRYPMFVFWGPQLIKIYNDAYRPITGHKHPWALGRPAREVWPEIWSDIEPLVARALNGDATWSRDLMLFMERSGFPEEVYFTFSYSPVPDESGGVGGMFCACTETTHEVLGRRRIRTLRDLAAAPADARTVAEACSMSAHVLAGNAADVPFALVYLIEADGTARLAASAGVREGEACAPPLLPAGSASPVWPIHEVAADRSAQDVVALGDRLTEVPPGPWPEPPAKAVVLPLVDRALERGVGAVVLGVSARRPFDDDYRSWFGLVAGQLGASISNARAAEEERRRVEALAEIDRAKSAFFSNVSHEFRTPLTLMLSPLEEHAREAPPEDWVGQVYRNALRLQKLVNSLLEFSRIEAGRVQAEREPTNIGEFTADVASLFRSAIEKAGLRYVVDVPPSAGPASIDRMMWEKVVLNLISNAFKFTLSGEIRVTLRESDADVRLDVSDTGSGIPAHECAHVFERFHRVHGTKGRTLEGAGIGLALSAEFVKLHDGDIRVESAEGRGSTFSVVIPRVAADGSHAAGVASAYGASPAGVPFVEEALRWLPDAAPEAAAFTGERILVADDNADMRAYLRRLLGTRWSVTAAVNGREALERVRAERPDAVIADVMMPELDGFELLAAVRADPAVARTPIVLLSARAGEEARAEGFEAGADDYVVKPFSARELVARVETQLLRSRVRDIEQERRLRIAEVFHQAPAPIALLLGPDHVFAVANDAYLSIIGRRDVVGLPVRSALPELADQPVFDLLDRVYRTGEPYVGRTYPLRLERDPAKGPEEVFFDFVYQPMRDRRGEVEGIAVVAFDVTHLVTMKSEAEAASRAKDEFLAMLGHELRNPLAPLATAVQLLRLRNITTAERECAVIERQVSHLSRMVDDLLDVSRVARGKVELRMRRVDVVDVVGRAIEMASPLIEQHRHTLVVDVAGGLTVRGDEGRLAQVVANLLTNAARYTDPGGRILVRGASHGGELSITVEDTGKGIPADLMPHIFELFAQGPQSADRPTGGLGIGLALVKGLVEAHGGSVHARSDGAGRGAAFTVRLPHAGPEAAPEVAAAAAERPLPAPRGAKVLVVDDNADAADMLQLFLSSAGYEVRTAHDGPTSLVVAAEFQPDVAILDIGLPVMDGYELARRIREVPGLSAVRVIALTGYGLAHDVQRSQEAGFDVHLLKPVDMDALLQTIGETAPPPKGA